MSDKPLLCVDYTPTRIFRNLDIPVSTIKEIRTRGDAGARDEEARGYGHGGMPFM